MIKTMTMPTGPARAGSKGAAALTLTLGISLSLPHGLFAQTNPVAPKPMVKVVDPFTIEPLIGAAPWNAGGPATHRMVVSHEKDGSIYLDIGYNNYKKGVILATPYAYKTDELCFSPSGKIRLKNEGDPFIMDGAKLMWRPAGAPTRSAEFLEDTVTICAMAPARLNANGHRVAPEDVGKWYGDPALKPMVKWFAIADAPVIPALDKSASPGVVEREVLSRRRDGSAKVSVTYITLKAGSHFTTSSAGDAICYVNFGSLSLTAGGVTLAAKGKAFIYRPDGAQITEVKATSESGLTCFSGPASL
jgi:hypothetical protein